MKRVNSFEHFAAETVVGLAAGVVGVQAPDGNIISSELLGPGIVKEIGNGGLVRIFWTTAQVNTWTESLDIEPAGPGAHVISVFRCDTYGGRTHERTEVITRAGLTHNWTVELRPSLVIRTLRSDGLIWTFDWDPVFRRAQPHGTILEDPLAQEDHAEALTVADLARK